MAVILTPSIMLQSRDAVIAEAVIGSLPSTFWLAFMGCLLLEAAAFTAVSQYHVQANPKVLALFLLYAAMFGISVQQAEVGYYSSLRKRVDKVLSRFTLSLYLNDMEGNKTEALLCMLPVATLPEYWCLPLVRCFF